jgi:glycosyltransferase involved in cell wall biosynthesis
VIIPAHNEEAVIGACLRAILEGMEPGELEIVVVCNGCRDRTAAIARTFGPGVRVIETEIASKSHALRLGDDSATAFPRFYVDADVVLPLASIRAVAAVLSEGHYLAAAPRMEVDLRRSNRWVRAYYRVWLRLPYHAEGTIGSGVYAVSCRGRRRFGPFPDLISDDGYARLQFAPHERVNVAAVSFTLRAPECLREVLRIKTRSQKGALQLLRAHPELAENERRNYRRVVIRMLCEPAMWFPCAVYLYVLAVTKARARWLNYKGDLAEWERDDSSRRLSEGVESER